MSTFAQAAATMQTLSLTAMEEASRRGQREADIDHLLLALVINDQSAGQVLRGLGMTLDAAREAVSAVHADQVRSLGLAIEQPEDGRIVFHETDGYELTGRVQDVFTRSGKGKNTGDASAVLRELVADPSGLIAAVLHRLDTSPDDVLRRLDHAERHAPERPHDEPGSRAGESRSTHAFVPAPVEHVWSLLVDPARMPEWEPYAGAVGPAEGDSELVTAPVPGQSWITLARTRHPDGKPIRVKEQFRRRRVELLDRTEPRRIQWRFDYPAAKHSNPTQLLIELAPTEGGTGLVITTSWRRRTGWRRAVGWVLRPVQRLVLWLNLLQVGGGISRVFR